MKKIRLDIGGPKGNAFYILATVRQFADGKEDEQRIMDKMTGKTMKHLGMLTTYDDLLRIYIEEFPFIELYATYELGGVDPALYTLDDDPDIIEL